MSKPSTLAQARAEDRLFHVEGHTYRYGHEYPAAESRAEAVTWAALAERTPLSRAVFKTWKSDGHIGAVLLSEPRFLLAPAGQLALPRGAA